MQEEMDPTQNPNEQPLVPPQPENTQAALTQPAETQPVRTQPEVPQPNVPRPAAPQSSQWAQDEPLVPPLVPPMTPPVTPPVTRPTGTVQQDVPVNIEDAGRGAEFNNNYQRFADAAGKQMEEAADALRRGEFARDSVHDPSADADDRLVGLLAYVVPVLLPAIILLSDSSQKRPFQRFHAVQSLGLSGAMVLASVAVGIVSLILGVIPVINFIAAIVLFCLTPILLLMAVVAVVYYGLQAYQGKRFAIPGVTNFLINQGWL